MFAPSLPEGDNTIDFQRSALRLGGEELVPAPALERLNMLASAEQVAEGARNAIASREGVNPYDIPDTQPTPVEAARGVASTLAHQRRAAEDAVLQTEMSTAAREVTAQAPSAAELATPYQAPAAPEMVEPTPAPLPAETQQALSQYADEQFAVAGN